MQKKKILFLATVDGHILAFHLPYLKWFKEMGWEVHVAVQGSRTIPYCDKQHQIPIERTPWKRENLAAYNDLKKLIENGKFDIIHCHTPMGGVLGRVCSKKVRKKGTKVIYTAHGFHFYKGASVINWLLYYPIEKILSRYTDCLITINKEDYNLANKKNFKAKEIKLVHGTGVDLEKFYPCLQEEQLKIRRNLGFKENDYILMYVAELNENKNQKLLIEAIAEVKKSIKSIQLVLIGEDKSNGKYKLFAESKNVQDIVKFLGKQENVEEWLKICDLYVASSKREGLPVNIMEALASGKRVLAVKNRGHEAIIRDRVNGRIIDNNYREMSEGILDMYNSTDQIINQDLIISSVEKYKVKNIMLEMEKIYKKYMDD